MKKIYAEIGYGNDTFISTEIEDGQSEYRLPRFVIPKKIQGFYFRLWILRKVFILSTINGFVKQNKDRNKFKILIGVAGES